MRKKVLIIGYGNPLRGDDGLGWRAARALAGQTDRLPVCVLPCHQLQPELAEPISEADLVIFIDGCCDDRPGTLVAQPVTPDRSSSGSFSHRVSPAALLASAERLYGKYPEAVLFSVSGENFGYGEEFSAPVQAVFPALLERVQQACGIPSAKSPSWISSSTRKFS